MMVIFPIKCLIILKINFRPAKNCAGTGIGEYFNFPIRADIQDIPVFIISFLWWIMVARDEENVRHC